MPCIDTRIITPLCLDEKSRQVGYAETDVQRQERIAFMKMKESAQRVANWINESAVRVANMSNPYDQYLLSSFDFFESDIASKTVDRVDLDEGYDSMDEEPYVLYSTPHTPVVPSSVRSKPLPPKAGRRRGQRRQVSKLFAIPEEE